MDIKIFYPVLPYASSLVRNGPLGIIFGISFKTTTFMDLERPLYLVIPAFFFFCCVATTHSSVGSNFLFFDLLAHAGNKVDKACFVVSLGFLNFSQRPLSSPVAYNY